MNFRDYYDEHVAFVWRTLKRLGVPDSHVKDAMQEVHIVAFRALPEFENPDEAKTWIYRVCFRTAKDYRRRAHVRREVLDEEPVLRTLDPGANAEIQLQHAENLVLLDQALAMLEDGQRAVYILSTLEEMTGEEIARALDLPLGTVYSRLRLARGAFRRALTLVAARDRSPSGVGPT